MPEPLRVLSVGTVYPPRHLGGYEVIWQGVTEHLRTEGHTARVLVTDYAPPGAPAPADTDPGVFRELDWYWREHRWRRLSWRRRLALERHNGARFDHHVRELRPHVVAWWPMGGLSLSLIERARRAGLASVLFVLDPWPGYGRERDLWLRGLARAGPLARLAGPLTGIPGRVDWPSAGRWVFCSASMRDDVVRGGMPAAGGTILHPGIERRFLTDSPGDPGPWRGRLLYVGRVVEPKGVHTAVAALGQLPGARLTVVGDGDAEYRTRLVDIARELGVLDRLELRPPVARDRLPGVYRDADAVVFPVTWPEPWGLVPLEAMGAGTAVIATGTGGSGEYLRDGENALLFAPGDVDALAGAVQRLAGDDELRRRLLGGGRRSAEFHLAERFNASALAELRAAITAAREG